MPENATRTKPRIECNIAAQLEAKKAEHDAANRPASWFQLKLAVGLVFAIFGYALYVFLVRILLPMVRLEEGRRGSRTTGIVLLVFWCLLWLMFVWTYLRVILTKPGFAVDYIEKTARPEAEPWDGSEARSFDSRLAGPAYDATTSAHDHPETAKAPSMTQVDPTPLAAEHSIPLQPTSANERHPVDQVAEDEPSRGAVGPQLGSLLPSSSQPPASDAASSQPPASFDPAPESSTAQLQGEQAPPLRRSNASRCSAVQFPEPPDGYSVRSEYLNAERKPPQHAVLTEAYRWCTRCEIVKPYRAHHCRHCGTCVLKMDHHCPWVGTCVGARNYKYFYNFLQWSSVFTVYLFIVSLVVAIPQSGQSVDGHQIALVIIAGVFALFTSGLALTHTHMMLRNMTTIEQMGIARMKQRETMAAQRAVGCFNYPATRRLQKRWDREWGGLNTEGNLWWLGSSGDNWRMVMGDNKLAWFLPIPTSSGDDGLSYTPNPRFSPEGRWRRREEWPAELR